MRRLRAVRPRSNNPPSCVGPRGEERQRIFAKPARPERRGTTIIAIVGKVAPPDKVTGKLPTQLASYSTGRSGTMAYPRLQSGRLARDWPGGQLANSCCPSKTSIRLSQGRFHLATLRSGQASVELSRARPLCEMRATILGPQALARRRMAGACAELGHPAKLGA